MINPRIFGTMLTLVVVVACTSVVILSQNAMASQPCCPSDDDVDVDVEEAALAENATTMMTNQTSGNMTAGGTNSTND
jgi:FlaG/FlaF family flagellin (archaellin)